MFRRMNGSRRFRPWHGFAILLTLSACGGDDLLGPDAAQGIEGIVLLGPQCPVQSLENPCPIASALEVQVDEGAYAEVIVSFDTGIR